MRLPKLSLPITRKSSRQHFSKLTLRTSSYALSQSSRLIDVDAERILQQANVLALQKPKNDTPSWKCKCKFGSGTCNVTVGELGSLECTAGTCDSCGWEVELPGVFELPGGVFGRRISILSGNKKIEVLELVDGY
jgi:hypothetical protein